MYNNLVRTITKKKKKKKNASFSCVICVLLETYALACLPKGEPMVSIVCNSLFMAITRYFLGNFS